MAQIIREGDAPVAPAYSFSMLEMVTLESSIWYTIMCCNTRFIVSIDAQNLAGKGELVDRFYELKAGVDDPDGLCEFEDWVLDAIDEHIKRLVPTPRRQANMPTSLLEYFDAGVFVFELVNRNGTLRAVKRPYDPKLHGATKPKITIVGSHVHNGGSRRAARLSPEGRGTSPSGPSTRSRSSSSHRIETIDRSVLPIVPFFKASELVRAAGPDSLEEEICELPRHVRDVTTNQEYFFKAVDDETCFRRELVILANIQSLTERSLVLPTSKVAGLVYWDGQENVLMGMLLEWINGHTLMYRARSASITDRKRWMDQVDDTVTKLHTNGIVWGDVKPDNVMIGPSGDSLIIILVKVIPRSILMRNIGRLYKATCKGSES
jgi:hypothetical protein